VGKRFHDAENKIEMGSYELINANLGIRQKIENIELNFRLEGNNLMDKEYQATQGSPLPGREIRFSIGVSGNLNFL
jgi:outer membrane cobalamin receptor